MAQTTMESTLHVPPRVEKDQPNLAKAHLVSQARVHLASLERDLPSPAKAVAPMTSVVTVMDTMSMVTVKTMDMVALTVDLMTFRVDLMTQM